MNVRKNKSINQFLRCDFRYSGGWTVIQHRFDGSVDFNKDWAAYETGFGQAQSEYWLGLEHITKLSNSADTRIRIDLTDFQGHKAYVEHENFFVSDADDNYR
jgi:ficolin